MEWKRQPEQQICCERLPLERNLGPHANLRDIGAAAGDTWSENGNLNNNSAAKGCRWNVIWTRT